MARVGWGVLALVLLLSGCQGKAPETERSRPAGPSSPSTASADLRRAAEKTVRERLATIRSGDRSAFLATLDPDNEEFVATQGRYFDNLRRLPLRAFEISVVPGDLPVTIALRGEAQLVVRIGMQLAGYEDRPVVEQGLFTFVRGADGRALLTDDRDVKFDVGTGWLPSPWDVADLTVRRSATVLGIFDRETSAHADDILAQISQALAAVDTVVPPWRGRVVAYDIGDQSAMDRMSAMEIDNTAGVAFPVFGNVTRTQVVALRFAVNPAVLDKGDPAFVFRHELTHVALQRVDRGATVWLREGAADYVAAQALDPEAHGLALAGGALSVAGVEDLADGRDFYQVDSDQNYTVAWLVCECIAARRGRQGLWDLMRLMRRADFVTPGDEDRLLRREFGLDTAGLATTAISWAVR